MQITAMEFPYTSDITVVSQKQFDVHKKLYAGYVSKANEVCDLLKKETAPKGNATYSQYRELEKGQSYALNGVTLHELYFKNIGSSGGLPLKAFTDMLASNFGSYESWAAHYKACANSARGWAILAYEQRSKSLKNILLDTHDDGNIIGSFPILVLDMYEHAYFIDYANNKDEYIEKFMENICWDIVNSRSKALFADK